MAGCSQPYSYIPGDPLDEYIDLPRPDPNAALDVHGGQVELLERSRCFRKSTMTCLTCHDVHVTQHNLAELSCHKPDSPTFSQAKHHISDNCIDCHMPNPETNLIVFEGQGKKARPQVRNHWIKVYSEINGPVVNR